MATIECYLWLAGASYYKELTLSQRSANWAEIPLPPLETQQAIVAEIEAERALVDANRELITRFEKKIHDTINRVWAE